MKTRADTLLGRITLAMRPRRPWLTVRASDWWTRVLVAVGAQLRPAQAATPHPSQAPRPARADHARRPAQPGLVMGYPGQPGHPQPGPSQQPQTGPGSVVLPPSDLRGANLTGANLIGAHLTDADLTDANLSEATIFGTTLDGATWTDQAIWGDWGSQMRAQSEPLGDGRYRIRRSGNSGADTPAPHVQAS